MNPQYIKNLIDHGLENDRTRLTVITDVSQAAPLREMAYAEPALMRYSPSEIHDEALFDAYFSKAIEGLKNHLIVPFLIFDKVADRFAGSTRFGNISAKDQRVEIGWTWLGKHFQRTGLNRHNKYVMLSHAFEIAGCERVELKADGANVQSRTAMEGIGATYEGALRSHTLMPDGRRRDTVYYSILKDEWPSVKERLFTLISK